MLGRGKFIEPIPKDEKYRELKNKMSKKHAVIYGEISDYKEKENEKPKSNEKHEKAAKEEKKEEKIEEKVEKNEKKEEKEEKKEEAKEEPKEETKEENKEATTGQNLLNIKYWVEDFSVNGTFLQKPNEKK